MGLADVHLKRLYRAALFFGIAYGLFTALAPLQLDGEGLGEQDIARLFSCFALGVVANAIPSGVLVRRFSAKHTLIACAGLYALCLLAFPFVRGMGALALVRFIDGASSVGVWVSAETILLSRSDAKNKALYASYYAFWLGIGYVLGSGVAWGLSQIAPLAVGFVLAMGVVMLTASYAAFRFEKDLPVLQPQFQAQSPAMTAAAGPVRSSTTASIFWRIKNSCLAAYVYGHFQAAISVLLPLYLIHAKHILSSRTTLLAGFFSLGMLLATNAVGRLGDRFGHLRVIRLLAAVGTLATLSFIYLNEFPFMAAAVFIAGLTFGTISPVSLALQGLSVGPIDYSGANSIYNMFYAAGSLIGPLVAGWIFVRYGGGAMLLHLASLWAAFILFSIVFRRDDPGMTSTPLPAGADICLAAPGT